MVLQKFADLERDLTPETARAIWGDFLGEHFYKKYTRNNYKIPLHAMDSQNIHNLETYLTTQK